MKKITITKDQAIQVIRDYALPGDFGCETWAEVMREASLHVDGIAAALEIDEEYIVI
jgi:hypothetical protein